MSDKNDKPILENSVNVLLGCFHFLVSLLFVLFVSILVILTFSWGRK